MMSDDVNKKFITDEIDFIKDEINEVNSIMNIEIDDEDLDFDELLSEYVFSVDQLEKEMESYSPKLGLGYTKLRVDAFDPKYNYETDSGFDLHSTEEIIIPKFGRSLVPTGLSFDIKDGYEIQVRSKSGLALNQGLMVLNSPGTVDNGYTGEVKVIVFNTTNDPVTIPKGMKIAQAVLCPVVNGKWVDLINKDSIEDKDRGDNGFGSTGI
jgi:dUTP pyrophosphatase